MSELFPKQLQEALPKLCEQEGNRDPTVHAVFYFPLSGWTWLATEGRPIKDDFLFFGYVVGLEREWGYFCLSELESVEVNGIKVCRDATHVLRTLSECLWQFGLEKN